MQIFISDPIHQTWIFGSVLALVFLVTFVRKHNYTPLALTQELKGFAILAIVLAHVGYFLSTDTRFLFPLSILAGVGVNLFYFLSGYGLSMSQLRRGERPTDFYRRRLLRLFVPIWVVLAVLFTADFLFLDIHYGFAYMVRDFFGLFPRADLFNDVNAPLWYITLLLFYYLFFPLVFMKRRLWLSASLLYAAAWGLVQLHPPFLNDIIGMYQVHLLAFPLGVLMAWFVSTHYDSVRSFLRTYARVPWYVYLFSMGIVLYLIVHFAIHSNVGGPKYLEQDTSILTCFLIMLVFALKKRESKLLSLIGLYSYEIYLVHWPLMYRYDVLYKYLPAGVATLLYLVVFVILGMLLQRIVAKLFTLPWLQKQPITKRAA